MQNTCLPPLDILQGDKMDLRTHLGLRNAQLLELPGLMPIRKVQVFPTCEHPANYNEHQRRTETLAMWFLWPVHRRNPSKVPDSFVTVTVQINIQKL